MAKERKSFKEKQFQRFIETWEEMDDDWRHKAEAEIRRTKVLDAVAEAQLTDVVTFGELYDEVKNRQKYFNKSEGLGCGLRYFDDATMGFRPGEVTVVAGPSNYGKTAIGLNIVTSLVVNTLKKVVIVSLEMTTEEILSRNYNMADEAQHEIMKDRIIVQKHRRISASYIGRIIERNKPDIVFVDHLQFLANREKGEEYERVSRAMSEIKNLALEYMIPIIIVSHVSKSRSGKHGEAANADLKGSSAIEQDADIVLMINRPADLAQGGEEVILTLTKHRTKRPKIFLKDCLLKFDGIRIADKGVYGLYNQ